MDRGSRVLADALEHVEEIVVGVDRMQASGNQQTLEDADVLGALLSHELQNGGLSLQRQYPVFFSVSPCLRVRILAKGATVCTKVKKSGPFSAEKGEV